MMAMLLLYRCCHFINVISLFISTPPAATATLLLLLRDQSRSRLLFASAWVRLLASRAAALHTEVMSKSFSAFFPTAQLVGILPQTTVDELP